MKRERLQLYAIALLAAALPGAGSAGDSDSSAALVIDTELRDALSGIDYVPDRSLLDGLLGADADSDLAAIGRDVDGEVDSGLRIRAYRALALYPSASSQDALLDAVADHSSVLITQGVEVVYAKVAMDSLATVAGGGAVGQIGVVLDHPSRDLRAAAASALAKTGSVAAISPLRARRAIETEPLVIVAIERALAALEPPP